MSGSSATQQADTALIDDALAVVREARSRAPADFMFALDRLSQRRGSPLTDPEREAWQEFVDDYRATVGRASPIERVRSVPAFRQRLADLEARGNRTLAEFPVSARDVPWE